MLVLYTPVRPYWDAISNLNASQYGHTAHMAGCDGNGISPGEMARMHGGVFVPWTFAGPVAPVKKEKPMRNPFFSRVSNALDAADRLPDQMGKSTYLIRETGDCILGALKVIAFLLFGLLVTNVLNGWR